MAAASGTHIVDGQSLLATTSELDLFSVPPTQVAISSGHWVCVQSKNRLDDFGPWSFELQTGPYYAQMSKNYLYLKLKFVRTDSGADSPITNEGNNPGDNVGPINLLASTFFKTLRLYIGNKLISDSNDLYAYRSILEAELNFNDNVKKYGHLKSGLYAQDGPGGAVDTVNNAGFKERKLWFNKSQAVEMMTPLHSDLFNSQKLLPANTRIRVELNRNDDSFCLINHNTDLTKKYALRVVDMKWYVRLIDISKSAHLAIESTIQKYPVKIPIRRTQMSRVSVSQEAQRTPHFTLFSGEIPRRIVLGFVSRTAFNGDATASPFNFKNFGLEEISITAGGIKFPRDSLKMKFSEDMFLRSYLNFLESTGMGYPNNQSCAIDPKLYKDGMCLFAFDLTPDESDGGYWDLTRQGPTFLEASFEKALDQAIEIIVYAEFDGLIRIDRNREAHLNYMV